MKRYLHRSLGRRAIVSVVAVVMGLFALEAMHECWRYGETIHRAEQETGNLASSLVQHADDTFGMADGVLAILQRRLNEEGQTDAGLRHADDIMRVSLANTPRIKGLFVYDATGEWLAWTSESKPQGVNNSDRDYFAYHRDHVGTAALIGPPVKSKTSGDWIMTITRRLDDKTGRFAGVVLASIDARYFASFFERFHLGKGGVIAIANSQGLLLSREPFDERAIGMDISASPLFLPPLATLERGAYHYVSTLDNAARISGFARSQMFPLVVAVGVSRDEILAPWFNELLLRGGIVLAFALGIALLGLGLAEALSKRQRAEAQLSEREAEFRLIAESAGDFVSRVSFDGIRIYASPASRKLFGREPEAMLGLDVNQGIHPDDLPAARASADRLRSGASREETITYRSTHADGREIWLETVLHVADALEGEMPSAVSVTRDVTERKQLETQLAAMARVDGMTGLANRRAFDEAFSHQWRRAQREGQALSLLLIDVDRFKYYNDTYGHQAGDTCLVVLATCVNAFARRPEDLAARYGGEELVVLLPGIGSAEALSIAAELCLAVQGLGVPHERNLPWGVATVSIGVATLPADMGFEETSSIWLLRQADKALYAAKANGRNRALQAPYVSAELAPIAPRLAS